MDRKIVGRVMILTLVCLALWLAPALGEEQAAKPPAPESIEVQSVEAQSAPDNRETAVETEKAEAIPEIEVFSFKEKAATSTVVTKEEIDMGPYMNLPGYLQEQTGIDLTRRSLLGVQNSQMRLRGFDESRYQVYMNGRTWKGAGVKGGFYVDWSTITNADLERLEILRGGLSAEYPNTLGGVIIINTIRGSKEPKLYLDTYFGSWNTQNYRVLHTGSKGPFQYVIGFSFGNSDGYLRNNWVRDRIHFNTGLTYTTPFELSISGEVRYITQDTGWIVPNIPGNSFFDPNYPASNGDGLYGPPVQYRDGSLPTNGLYFGDNSYTHNQRWEWDLELKQKFWQGEAILRWWYFQAIRNDTFYALNDPSLVIGKRNSWDEDTWGWNFKIRQTLHNIRMGFGLEGLYAGYGQTQYSDLVTTYFNPRSLPSDSAGPRNALKTHGGFVDAAIPFWKYLELYLGLRYDYWNAAPAIDNFGVLQPGGRANALGPRSTLTVKPTDKTEFYLSANYVTRFPTLPEYYWFVSGYQSPLRPAYLSPEFGMQYEAGITQLFPTDTKLKVRAYYYDINNYIRTVMGFAPSRVIYNINLVEWRGAEVEITQPLPYNLTAWANYTYQTTTAGADPIGLNVPRLTELPEHKANWGLTYKDKNGVEAKIYLRMVSQRSQAQVNVKNNLITGVQYGFMKGFVTTGAEVRYPVANWKGFTGSLYAGVDNLFGVKYMESYGFPMPPETFYGGIQLRY